MPDLRQMFGALAPAAGMADPKHHSSETALMARCGKARLDGAYTSALCSDAGDNTEPSPKTDLPRRRVSIATDVTRASPLSAKQDLSRKFSVATEYVGDSRKRKQPIIIPCECGNEISIVAEEVASGRRKSILKNGRVNNLIADNSAPPCKDVVEQGKDSMMEIVVHKLEDLCADDFRNMERSWCYELCMRCRQPDEGMPSWEPPLWRRLFPPPYCPSYRRFAQVLALVMVGLLVWGSVFAIAGDTAAPGGQLFGLAALVITAHFGGWFFSLLNLPALVGMLAVGAIFQNAGLTHIDDSYKHVVTTLRHVALVIILIRAGLDLDPRALRSMWTSVLKLGILPWIVECVAMMVVGHSLLHMSWTWGLLLGSIIAAVSPAVVVPSLFRLRKKGYGVSKGIPTLVIAVSSIDDALSVAAFGIISSLMFTSGSLTFQILQGPITLIGGIGFGIFWGLLSKYVPETNDPYAVPLRILMLLGGGVLAMLGSEEIGIGGAGPLSCVTSAFVSITCWSQQGWEIEDNPVATAFEIFWMIFEPILFGITGTQLKISELDADTVAMCIICLVVAIVVRILATMLLSWGSKLNLKEKIFVSLAWMSKAGVQAALGPVALATVASGTDMERSCGKLVLTTCLLSILLTAPTGAVLITLSGSHLLKKTSAPQLLEGWRRSRKPSMRDFTVEDDEEHLVGEASVVGR